jgi:two-component system cell cycle response regulator DivK
MANILIVDDDDANLAILTGLMRAAGHNVFAVSNGHDALVSGEYAPPDLVLCDVRMPVMSGVDVVREFRYLGFHMPIVAVTALANPGDRERALAAGFDGYFAKPISPRTFARDLEAFLETRSAAAPPAGERPRER